MNKTEAVRSALRFEPNGPVPYSVNLTAEAYEAYGKALIEDFGTEQVKQDFGAGRLNLREAATLAIGNYIIYLDAPWWDWTNLPLEFQEEDTPQGLPDTIGRGSYEAFFEKAAYLKEHYDAYLLVTIWGSHWEKAYFSRGIENFLYDLAADPDWCQQLLDLIIRKNLVMLENILTCPNLDGILLGSDWGTQNDLIMSPQCFRSLIKGGEKREYDLIKKYGKNVFVHSCGNITRIMEDLAELGVECLNPIQPECMDIYRLKEQYGSKMAFYGGISTQRVLPFGTPAEVEAETRRVVQAMSKNGGFITAPSQEIQEDVPYENLCALIRAAQACVQR